MTSYRTSDSSEGRPVRTINLVESLLVNKAAAGGWRTVVFGIGATLIAGLLLLLGVRLLVIHHIQEPLEGRLEYMAAWLGLPASVTDFTWMLTFGLSAFAAWPFCKKFLFFATGIPWFCPKPAEWALLLTLPASTLLPYGVQTIYAIREVDPSTAAWFYPDPDVTTGQPQGRIGYLRESDGEWKFYNIPTFLRETDAAPVQRVTPEIRRQWQEDYQRQQQVLKVRNAAEQISRDATEKLRREHDSKLAQIRLESERIAAQRAQTERAKADAERARADESRAQAEAAKVRGEADKAAANARNKQLSIVQTSPVGNMNRTSQVSLQSYPGVSTNAGSSNTELPRLLPRHNEIPIRWGMTLNVPIRGDSVEIWSDGPIAVSADAGGENIATQPGRTLRFQPGFSAIHVRPLHPGATRLYIRKL